MKMPVHPAFFYRKNQPNAKRRDIRHLFAAGRTITQIFWIMD
jgi:hypothetical protein